MWFGKVVRLSAGLAFVIVPDLSPDRVFGPLAGIQGVTLAVGDRLLLGALANRPEDLVIIRRMP